MARTMNGFTPKGRVRTNVGHKYLEALQSRANGDSDSSTSSSPPSVQKSPGLDLLILGITSGTAMDDIDFALCRFTQETPESPLCLDLIKVPFNVPPRSGQSLSVCSTTQLLCPPRFEPTYSQCYEKMLLRRACSPRWMPRWVIHLQTQSTSSHTSTAYQWMTLT
jgi:hypothetical protein